MKEQLISFTTKEIRSLAYELYTTNNCLNPFRSNNEMAGFDWLHGFSNRHPNIYLRSQRPHPQPMQWASINVFSNFSDLLTKVNDKHHLTPDKIYNVGETNIIVNPNGQSKILALEACHPVGVLSFAKKGENLTGVMCFSASGAFVHPMLIFPRKIRQQAFQLNLLPGAWTEVYETGWMTKPLFCTWFEKFIGISAQKESPVLLLLDGHRSHTKSLQLINTASENRVIMLYFPPHCTHRLSIGLHLIQHQMRSLAPAQIHKELRYLVVGLQLKNIFRQYFLFKVPQKSFLSQKMGKTRKKCHEKGVKHQSSLPRLTKINWSCKRMS